MKMKSNVVVYGLGKYYESISDDKIRNYYNILGHSDQNLKLAKKYDDFVSPGNLAAISLDYVLITSIYYKEIINDLVERYGISWEKIVIWQEDERRRDYFNDKGTQFAFGQFGEDYVIGNILKEKEIKIREAKYIEIGVDHPYISNHTYFLHLAGAEGVLVDANPESINLIKVVRKHQTVLNCAVSDKKGKQTFYISNVSGYSSLDLNNIKLNHGDIKKEIVLDTVTINDVLSMQNETAVLSIDCEGYDKTILKSIDFERFHPEVICTEIGKPEEKLVEYMNRSGYCLAFCNYINSIWKRV